MHYIVIMNFKSFTNLMVAVISAADLVYSAPATSEPSDQKYLRKCNTRRQEVVSAGGSGQVAARRVTVVKVD